MFNIRNTSNESENNMTLLDTFVEEFPFHQKRKRDEKYGPDFENFSFIVFLLIAWVKKYEPQITFSLLSPIHYQIKIIKNVQKDSVYSLLSLIEELTLTHLQVIDNVNDQEWILNFYF